jgi:hypothetical protein
MSGAYSDHANGLSQLQNELGSECPAFTWCGKPWPILPGGALFKRENSTGGFTLDTDLQLTVLTAQFQGNLPDAQDEFQYQGHTYRIKSITTPGNGFQMRIHADLAAGGM